jgi:predicted SAM-dependent methyltransferase
MSVKSTARAWLQSAGLYEGASRAWMWLEPRMTNAVRSLTGRDRRAIGQYLAAQPQPRLHIGCGDNHLSGWLNTELCPRRDQIFLDATRPFPFADRTFAFIYSEHMIEHIPYANAVDMIRECFRVLQPGGSIRIVTPDLAFLQALLDNAPNPQRAAYFEFYQRHNRLTGPFNVTHFVNHFVRAWGHQFIYDADTLIDLLRGAGFENVRQQPLTDSGTPAFAGIAKLDRMPDGFLEMESLTVEARKPE